LEKKKGDDLEGYDKPNRISEVYELIRRDVPFEPNPIGQEVSESDQKNVTR
jgi:hypothetical protein